MTDSSYSPRLPRTAIGTLSEETTIPHGELHGEAEPSLTQAIILAHTSAISRTLWSDNRVTAYTMNGVHVCPAGVGEGAARGTIPAKITVAVVLGMMHWIRFKRPWEASGDGQWWDRLGWQPLSVVHSNGALAWPDDPIGLHGSTVTVLQHVARETTATTDAPQACLDEVCTPPTSPPPWARVARGG